MSERAILHGGNLLQASAQFGIPASGWQDLSTGISPRGYPVPELPASVWQRLPEDDLALREAAADYYQVSPERLFPLPGSQFAIARLPHYLTPARVALPRVGYQEHQHAWSLAGHTPVFYCDGAGLEQLVESRAVDHAVIINPNNPTGELLEVKLIHDLALAISGRGMLLVDEAFVDLRPESSACGLTTSLANLWILRSLGKFFGLAGVRLGFLISDSSHAVVKQLSAELSPWGISHPAQWLGALALHDKTWQAQQRSHILKLSNQVSAAIQHRLGAIVDVANAGLFITLSGNYEFLYRLHLYLGEHGIYTRWCHLSADLHTQSAWLRLGLPGDGGERLVNAMATWQF